VLAWYAKMSRLASSAPATRTKSPQTIGELVPGLGIGFFQVMLSAVQVSGAFLCAATALPVAPRKAGQVAVGETAALDVFVSATGAGAGVLASVFGASVLGASAFGASA